MFLTMVFATFIYKNLISERAVLCSVARPLAEKGEENVWQ